MDSETYYYWKGETEQETLGHLLNEFATSCPCCGAEISYKNRCGEWDLAEKGRCCSCGFEATPREVFFTALEGLGL